MSNPAPFASVAERDAFIASLDLRALLASPLVQKLMDEKDAAQTTAIAATVKQTELFGDLDKQRSLVADLQTQLAGARNLLTLPSRSPQPNPSPQPIAGPSRPRSSGPFAQSGDQVATDGANEDEEAAEPASPYSDRPAGSPDSVLWSWPACKTAMQTEFPNMTPTKPTPQAYLRSAAGDRLYLADRTRYDAIVNDAKVEARQLVATARAGIEGAGKTFWHHHGTLTHMSTAHAKELRDAQRRLRKSYPELALDVDGFKARHIMRWALESASGTIPVDRSHRARKAKQGSQENGTQAPDDSMEVDGSQSMQSPVAPSPPIHQGGYTVPGLAPSGPTFAST